MWVFFENTELKKIASEINAKKGSQQTLPTLETLIRHTSYLFVNSHPLLDFTRPVPEKVKFVGGIVDVTGAELPPEESLDEVSEIRSRGFTSHYSIITHSHMKNIPRIRYYICCFSFKYTYFLILMFILYWGLLLHLSC